MFQAFLTLLVLFGFILHILFFSFYVIHDLWMSCPQKLFKVSWIFFPKRSCHTYCQGFLLDKCFYPQHDHNMCSIPTPASLLDVLAIAVTMGREILPHLQCLMI